MATTTIHMHQIVSVRADRRISAEGYTWRHIILTDADGRETKIALFPADDSKPEQISIIDEERPHA
jgi:hypothetical protein